MRWDLEDYFSIIMIELCESFEQDDDRFTEHSRGVRFMEQMYSSQLNLGNAHRR